MMQIDPKSTFRPIHPKCAERIRGYRTQEAYAQRLGVSRATVQRWEKDGPTLAQSWMIYGHEASQGGTTRCAYALEAMRQGDAFKKYAPHFGHPGFYK